MYRLSNLSVPLTANFSNPVLLVEKALRLQKGSVTGARLSKKSVDARDKGKVQFVVSVDFTLSPAVPEKRLLPPRGAALSPFKIPQWQIPTVSFSENRPVVVGFGPAGFMAALALARAGLRPIVLERGYDVDRRRADVEAFFLRGILNPSSNIQFGEGGAGAFSDGKLNSGIKDPRCAFVLRELVAHGAPEEILWQGRPHIGTDRLPGVVRSIREEILRLGGEIRFGTRCVGLIVEDCHLLGLMTQDDQGRRQNLPCREAILAIGHSARDTFARLASQGVPMEAKPFSIGVRIEQLQASIDRAQYGAFAGHPALGAAEYRLSAHTRSGRGVYTFCMCPGGDVVAAASEACGVVTNGMSPFARNGRNANSALLVSVSPEDFPGQGPLAGMEFQRQWEQAAWRLGGEDYHAPAQLTGDFLQGKTSSGPREVLPSYRPGVRWCDLSACLPAFVVDALREAIPILNRKLFAFASTDTVLTGVETRSSSPVRILRGPNYESLIAGLYPAGEGAGYAGGILSAAVDGLRCAEAVILKGAHHG